MDTPPGVAGSMLRRIKMMNGRSHRYGRKMITLVLGLLFASGALRVTEAQAGGDWAQHRGFRFGIYASGSGINAEDPPAGGDPDQLFLEEDGGGMGFMVGYTFSRRFSLCLGVSSTRHDSSIENLEAYYATSMIEAHYQLLPRERIRPYLIGGLGGVGLAIDTKGYDSETRGGGMVLGVGMAWNLSEHLLLDTSLRLDIIEWDEVEFTRDLPSGQTVTLEDPVDEEKGGAGRVQCGFTWAF